MGDSPLSSQLPFSALDSRPMAHGVIPGHLTPNSVFKQSLLSGVPGLPRPPRGAEGHKFLAAQRLSWKMLPARSAREARRLLVISQDTSRPTAFSRSLFYLKSPASTGRPGEA